MKILHFAHSFFPVYGGTSTRLYNLLLDKTNEHYLYVPYPLSLLENLEKPPPKYETFGNINVRRFEIPSKYCLKLPFLPSINKIRNIKKISDYYLNLIEDKKIDIVHGHNPIIYGISMLKYAKNFNLPFLYEAHLFGTDFHFIHNKLKWNLNNFYEMKIYKNADAIIIQTTALKERLTTIFNIIPEKVKIIPVGVDEDLFNPKSWLQKAKELRIKKGWDDKIIFLYSGYLREYNGVKFFLNAAINLEENIKKKVKIVIIGRGPLKSYVQKLSFQYQGFIDFLSQIDYQSIPIYYAASDIAISARLNHIHVKDSVPQKLVELMAMEKIILASNADATKEIIRDNYNGILFESGNKANFLKKFRYLVENFQSLDHLGKNARETVLENYKWSNNRNKLQKIYEELINKKK